MSRNPMASAISLVSFAALLGAIACSAVEPSGTGGDGGAADSTAAGSSSGSGTGSSSSGAGRSSSGGSRSNSSSSSSGSGAGCGVACTLGSDCTACGAPQAGFVTWCCTNSMCYGWSTVACPMGGSSSGGSGGDAAQAGGDSPCGFATCPGGTYCCDRTCGLCAPLGALCVQQCDGGINDASTVGCTAQSGNDTKCTNATLPHYYLCARVTPPTACVVVAITSANIAACCP